MGLRQVAPQDDVGWKAYHAIRQFVLYELRGRHDYDASHPDDYKVGNIPFLYDVDNLPIGAVRLDFSTADPVICHGADGRDPTTASKARIWNRDASGSRVVCR